MSAIHRPIIGVTGPDRGGLSAWIMTRIAIHRAGGCARRITPARPCSIEELDGLVIGGGADIDPSLYGETLIPQFQRERRRARRHRHLLNFLLLLSLWLMRAAFSTKAHVNGDPARDALERRLIDEAYERGLPILGICRGMQLLNVARGGSLHQEIADFYVETPHLRTVLPKKKVEVEPQSILHRLFGKTMMRVNSLHHQSVRKLGSDMHIAAREPNGIIQAIEDRSRPFVIGVQWHPEFLPQERTQQALFRELVRNAGPTR